MIEGTEFTGGDKSVNDEKRQTNETSFDLRGFICWLSLGRKVCTLARQRYSSI